MKRPALKWLLPLLAVVLNLGGGPMAWAQLAPASATGAEHGVTSAASMPHGGAVSLSQKASDVAEHCAGTEDGSSGKSPPQHGGPQGCCAVGACHCSCPSPLSMSVSSPAIYERPLAPANAIRAQVASPRYGRILRPPIS